MQRDEMEPSDEEKFNTLKILLNKDPVIFLGKVQKLFSNLFEIIKKKNTIKFSCIINNAIIERYGKYLGGKTLLEFKRIEGTLEMLDHHHRKN